MSEQAPKDSEKLRTVMSLTERALEGVEQRPGSSYRPIHVKFGRLLRRAEILGGYEPDPLKISGESDWWSYLGDSQSLVRPQVRELYSKGLLRSRSLTPMYAWPIRASLSELRPARLAGRQVVPIPGTPIYDIKAHISSSDGRGPDSEYERIIYSPTQGVLEYDAIDWLKQQQVEGKIAADPLDRAEEYLRKGLESTDE